MEFGWQQYKSHPIVKRLIYLYIRITYNSINKNYKLIKYTTMVNMIKEFYTLSKEVYHTDRKEFWDTILGMVLIVSLFLVTFYVLIPIFTEGHSYLD